MNFDPWQHQYTTHSTYTGPGCAHCGKSERDHVRYNDEPIRYNEDPMRTEPTGYIPWFDAGDRGYVRRFQLAELKDKP